MTAAQDPHEVFWLYAEPAYDRVDDLTRARLNVALDAALAVAGAPMTENDDDGFGVCGNAWGWWLAGTLAVLGLLATCGLWAALLWPRPWR